MSSRAISPLTINKEEEQQQFDDEKLLQQDEEGRKVLNFRELREFYNELCKSQAAEARIKMGKNWLENFQRSNLIRPNFKEDLPRPENYKKMCELQLEEIRQTDSYQKLSAIESVRKVVEGPKQYLCSKCGQPKRGHVCKAIAENDEKVLIPQRRRPRDEDSGMDPEDRMTRSASFNRKRSRSSYSANDPTSDQDVSPASNRRSKMSFDSSKLSHETRKFNGHLPNDIYSFDFKNKHYKVIVVGAGIAGLAAARELRTIGFDVTVVEARDRIGGRIHTITSDDLKSGFGVDIGASFLHSAEYNPFTELCKELGVPIHNFGNSVVLYDITGKQIPSVVDSNAETIFHQFLDEVSKIRGKPCYFSRRRLIRGRIDRHQDRPGMNENKSLNSYNEEMSLGKAINDILLQWQKKNNNISNELWGVLNWYFANVEGIYGADLSLLSLNSWDQDDSSPTSEGDSCLIYQGYGHIINHLSQGLDVRLGHRVDKISYDSNQKAKVETNKGIIEGDFVICTLPLGILKEGSVQFSPSLPQEKLNAIHSLGFGLLNKLILFFPTLFWDKTADFIGCTAGHNSDTRGEFYLFVNMEKVVGSPILVGLIGGQAALNLESRSGEEVVGQAMKFLSKIYPNAMNPTRAVVTRWAGDPFARGAFSYLPQGSNGSEYDTLSKPVGDRLYFGGEATHRQHPSTVTGAYLSGLRVATEVARRCINGNFNTGLYDNMDITSSHSSPIHQGPISAQIPLASGGANLTTISSPANLLINNPALNPPYNPSPPTSIQTPPPFIPNNTFSPSLGTFDIPSNTNIMNDILSANYSFRSDLDQQEIIDEV